MTRVGVGLVAVMVLLLGGASVPGWLLLPVVVTAMVWGVAAGVEQKRLERRFAEWLWRAVKRRDCPR